MNFKSINRKSFIQRLAIVLGATIIITAFLGKTADNSAPTSKDINATQPSSLANNNQPTVIVTGDTET